jgi:hypothetical protein
MRARLVVDADSGDNQRMLGSDTHRRRSRAASVRRYDSMAEADRHDLEFWMQVPEAERVLEV